MNPPDVHLCLLSEQPSPNLCPLLDSRLKPREVHFVVTPQQKARVPNFEAVLGPRGIRVSTLEITDAWCVDESVRHIESRIDELRARDLRVAINATGGTKPMSIAAYLAGMQKGLPVFYVHDDRVRWLINGVGEPEFALEDTLRLDAFLRVHGIRLVESQRARAVRERRGLAGYLIAHPDLEPAIVRLNRIAQTCEKTRSLDYLLDADDAAHTELNVVLDKLAEENLLSVTGRDIRFADNDSRAWCNGLWLEDHVAGVLDGLRGDPDLCIQDTCRSAVVQYVGGGRTDRRESDVQADNEVDVVALARNLLFVIECKTRRFGSATVGDVSDALYKLATLRRQLGGAMARAMFVSYHGMAGNDRRRAEILGIDVCTGRELQELESRLRRWVAPSSR